MKNIATAAFCALLATTGFAADLTREAKVERILDLTNARAMQEQMMAQMKQMAAQQSTASMTAEQKAKAQQMQTRIFDLVSSRLSWDKMRPMIVKTWADTFTDQELDGVLAFYESPAGRAMMQKMPTIMMKTMQQVQGLVADLQPEIQKMVKENGAGDRN